MARFTDIAGGDMRWSLAAGADSVMTLHTIRTDTAVIKLRADPCVGRVTTIAFGCRWDVRAALAARGDAVVTTGTDPDHICMVHRHRWPPLRGRMTCFANAGS